MNTIVRILSLVLLSSILFACNSNSSNGEDLKKEDVIDLELIHNDFLDNPEKYRGKKLRSVFYYDAIYKPGLSELLKATNGLGMTIKCYRYDSNSNNRMDLVFSISGKLDVPNVTYLDRVEVEFICTEGNLENGNEVISIKRG